MSPRVALEKQGEMIMKIMIGNDHGGFGVKGPVLEHLKSRGDIEIIDIGSHSEDIVRYPYYAARVAQAVAAGEVDRGILICSTGVGMSMVANHFAGVRATLCTSGYMGRMCRAHNDSNILCLGGRITGLFEILDILNAWLDTPYEGGRHNISLGLLSDLEKGKRLPRPDDDAEKEKMV